jgi:hypothetical protein
MKNDTIKKKIIPWNKGKKTGFIPWNKGEVGFQKGLRGELNWNWKGGITSLYKQVRDSFEYRQWRSDVFQRDNFTCQGCGGKGSKIQAHHIKPFFVIIRENKIKTMEDAKNCAKLWNINNGQTLCIPCHKKTNNYGWKITNNRRKQKS